MKKDYYHKEKEKQIEDNNFYDRPFEEVEVVLLMIEVSTWH